MMLRFLCLPALLCVLTCAVAEPAPESAADGVVAPAPAVVPEAVVPEAVVPAAVVPEVFVPAATVPTAPVARLDPAGDGDLGKTMVDRYRWMENDQDPDWLPFLHGQDAHARAVLAGIPGRDALLARIQVLSASSATPLRLRRVGARVFYQQRPAGANSFKLFVREAGKDRVLIDAKHQDAGEGLSVLAGWEPSPDGSRLVYGLARIGSAEASLQIMDVATGRVLPERIDDTLDAHPSWLADGTGFFYTQRSGKVGTTERLLDSRARFHRLGSDPLRDPIVMARGQDPQVNVAVLQSPHVLTFAHSSYAVLVLSDVRRAVRLLLAPLREVLAGHAHWRPLADFEDGVTDFVVDGERLYLIGHRDHPRGRVLRTTLSSSALTHASEVIAESSRVLQGLSLAQDGLYVRASDGGIGKLLRLGTFGQAEIRPLPFEGTLSAVATDPGLPGALLLVSSWLEPPAIWALDARGHASDTGITPRPPIDTRAYTSERRFARASDGVAIPYTLIYRKDLHKEGSHSVFVSADGSPDLSAYAPFFLARILALLDRGAMVGFAKVRAPGEDGEDGQARKSTGAPDNPPDRGRDLIAVCEDLVARGDTTPANLAIGARSSGAISVESALTARPELFAAAVAGLGTRDSARQVDSDRAVHDGTAYPAVLLTTGVSELRLPPFDPAKLTARLQAASSSGRPVLLRVDFDAEGSVDATREAQDLEAADTYAFILWQTAGNGDMAAR